MDVKNWRKTIQQQMEACGVYKESFDSSIDALAEILTERDRVKAQYEEEGSKPTVQHTQDRGAVNAKMNPLLKIWIDLNKQALDYWNSLGLTGKSYKQMTGSMSVQVESESLEKALADILA